MEKSPYLLSPKRVDISKLGDCPVFSDSDEYTANYEKISQDHLLVFESKGVNPFMDESVWSESEEIIVSLAKKYTPVNGLILDVGCGLGRLLSKLKEYDRYGMDISKAYLSHAMKVGGEFCMARVEDMPYKNNFFDTVVCTDVLEHVLDLNLAISQIFRVIKPGGHLIIRVPYRENLESYLHPEYPYEMAHLRNFDEHNLRLLFEKVFKGEVIDEILGPYVEHVGYLRYPIEFRGMRFIFKNTLKLISLFSNQARINFVKKFLNPVEISMVIKRKNQTL